ncbi:MAG TPA: hypothetical protein VKC61_25230 [Pyrinomonadaceae bacterium]|nr:hypothetical protein [Pyrinomonadaceae bacterium]
MKTSRHHGQFPFALRLISFSCSFPSPRLKKLALWPLALAALISSSLMNAGCAKTFVPSDANPTCTATAPEFAGWFEPTSVSGGVVNLNGIAKPADSRLSLAPNCGFHKWSEQMFLWLTSPVPPTYGGGGGHIFNSPVFFDVSPLDANRDRTFIPHQQGQLSNLSLRAAQVGIHNLQLVFDRKGEVLEVETPKTGPTGKQLILNDKGEPVEIERITMNDNKQPIFFAKDGKVIERPRAIIRPQLSQEFTVQAFKVGQTSFFVNGLGNVIDVEQGQAFGGVLMARNHSLVYYATTVNDVYAYALTGDKTSGPGKFNPTPTQLPTSQTELTTIENFAVNFGGKSSPPFPDPEALAIEIKTSWVEASAVSNISDYITMTATVPDYDGPPGSAHPNTTTWTPIGQKTVLLAMVGMHVVGSTGGQPELVWGTFEHESNTPNAQYDYNNSSSPPPKLVAQTTAGNWLFCAPNSSGPFNQQHMSLDASGNITANGTFNIDPSDTIRWKAWGTPMGGSSASQNTEVIALNNSVRGMLNSADVRNKYIFIGTTWTIGGQPPTSGNQVGTNRLGNTTMETYQQGSSNGPNGMNCFSCHGNVMGSNTDMINVSHIYWTPDFVNPHTHGLKPLF